MRVFLLLSPPNERLANDKDDSVEVRQHIIIPETEDLESLGFQERGAFGVARLAMLATIDLDDQHRIEASEVRDIGQQAVLETELEPVDLAVADGLPEFLLRIRSVTTELRGVVTDLASDCRHAWTFRRKKTLTQPAPGEQRPALFRSCRGHDRPNALVPQAGEGLSWRLCAFAGMTERST